MMGNFLTTLGNDPETDRAMFEELGLNVARQPDNAANPRPDNRSGWLVGRDPGRGRGAALRAPRAPGGSELTCGCGIPPRSCASAPSARSRPRPDGAPNRVPVG